VPEEEEEVTVKVLGGGVPSGSRGGGAPELGFRGRGADKEEDRGGAWTRRRRTGAGVAVKELGGGDGGGDAGKFGSLTASKWRSAPKT